jgi:nucleotide-binding universal stress UspA family protein
MLKDENEINYSPEKLKEMIAACVGAEKVPKQVFIHTDTSDFYRIDYDAVVVLGGRPYLVRNNEREGRFGIEEQQKYWVKRARDLTDGSTKILKLTFLERFQANVGGLSFECYRSPQKEARILEMVDGNLNFMQGHAVRDSAGNIIRIIEYITGKTFADFILELGSSHEDYFYNYFPAVLDEYIELVKAIQFRSGFAENAINAVAALQDRPSVAECILSRLTELKCSTVVVGRRGITRKEEFLFGSTSCKILREAKDCSIWVIQ